MGIVKIIAMLWPFVKEWFLGDMSVKEAMKHNKKKLVGIAIIMLMIIIIIHTVPKLFSVSGDYLALKKEYDAKCVPAMAIVEQLSRENKDFSKPVEIHVPPYTPSTKEDVVNRYPPDPKETKETSVVKNGSFADKKQSKTTKSIKPKQDSSDDRYNATRKEFERIKKLEEGSSQ